MRAVVHDTYGPPEVLRLEEVEQPMPKDDEVLIKVPPPAIRTNNLHLAYEQAIADSSGARPSTVGRRELPDAVPLDLELAAGRHPGMVLHSGVLADLRSAIPGRLLRTVSDAL
jgi:hypothetical protein